ncbi:hypothetical protein LCGC14_2237490 [marine sediment metagenome]|uniref:Coil containing protein n=1 Tax=marine sediment metagenome TaxID=412755 RepID=A0A0F9D6K4_9ZZZZ
MNETTKELTVQDRAVAALGLSNLEKELTELAGKSKDLVKITNADSYEQIDTARKVLKSERITITQKGKAARDDANAFSKAVIAEENRLVAIIQVEEKRLQAIQKAHDDAIEAEKQKLIDAELKRVETIQESIEAIQRMPTNIPAGASSGQIAAQLEEAEAFGITSFFEEFTDKAQAIKDTSVLALKALHAERLEFEAEQEKIKADRKELDELREAQEKRDKEAHEKQDEIDAEEQRLKEEREAFEKEKLAEANKKAAEEQAEKDRIEFEKQAEENRKKAALDAAARAVYPGEAAIVTALSEHFDVSDAVVMSWLSEIRKAA